MRAGILRVSVIATVLNEAGSIDLLLDSLAGQTRPPDEVVIVDGGSSDGTRGRLREYVLNGTLPLTMLVAPGYNISQGRNMAINHAQGTIIAATDAGVRLDPQWLEKLCEPFESSSPPDVVAGFFEPDAQSEFETALGAATLPRVQEIDPSTFNPSSRSVAFRKEAWEAVGGYPEWLDYCEDLVFDFALRDAAYQFAFAPDALAYFRPRPTLRAFYRQYYRYARGDGKADLWRYRHLIRYATYLVAVPTLLVLSVLNHWLWLVVLCAGAVGLMCRPVRRTWSHTRGVPLRRRLRTLLWLPLIVFAGDIAKMRGYPVGVWWRRHHAPKDQWAKRWI